MFHLSNYIKLYFDVKILYLRFGYRFSILKEIFWFCFNFQLEYYSKRLVFLIFVFENLKSFIMIIVNQKYMNIS